MLPFIPFIRLTTEASSSQNFFLPLLWPHLPHENPQQTSRVWAPWSARLQSENQWHNWLLPTPECLPVGLMSLGSPQGVGWGGHQPYEGLLQQWEGRGRCQAVRTAADTRKSIGGRLRERQETPKGNESCTEEWGWGKEHMNIPAGPGKKMTGRASDLLEESCDRGL